MTGEQLATVLVVGVICATVALVTWAHAWSDRARARAAEARERRVRAEVEARRDVERRASARAASVARHPAGRPDPVPSPTYEWETRRAVPADHDDRPEATS